MTSDMLVHLTVPNSDMDVMLPLAVACMSPTLKRMIQEGGYCEDYGLKDVPLWALANNPQDAAKAVEFLMYHHGVPYEHVPIIPIMTNDFNVLVTDVFDRVSRVPTWPQHCARCWHCWYTRHSVCACVRVCMCACTCVCVCMCAQGFSSFVQTALWFTAVRACVHRPQDFVTQGVGSGPGGVSLAGLVKVAEYLEIDDMLNLVLTKVRTLRTPAYAHLPMCMHIPL